MKIDEKTLTQLAEALARVIAYEDKMLVRDHYLEHVLPAKKLLKRLAPEVWKRIEAEAKASVEE